MVEIYVDADACPVREEIYRVAGRLGLVVHLVSNGSRPFRPPGLPNLRMVTVEAGADVADDWIAERITPQDVCVTSDIPLAARCLASGARAVAPNGHSWTADNIGSALAGREVARHLREIGAATGGPAPLGKAERSRFLSALDAAITAAGRERPAIRIAPPQP
ncbi:MAG: YaiI/YqxD family protein [Rhodospirillales bacterium]|nr:YaiI/YqxD family protein [Rhodospirillales bacterium]MDE2199547.1 YaiI/YqxD family protein [Rhodospirillales bacterium]MDE2576453.1 YaiI/YqxD family protein [Rhodospirillales bacterium]